MTTEQLADLIEVNPNCVIDIDNDVWYMRESEGSDNDLTTSESFDFKSKWYGHSSNYGFGVADALVILLNRKGFNIKVQAV